MPKFKHGNNKIEDTKSYTQKTEKIAQDSAVDQLLRFPTSGKHTLYSSMRMCFRHQIILWKYVLVQPTAQPKGVFSFALVAGAILVESI